MPILADIERLEERVSDILAGLRTPRTASEAMRRAVTDAVLSILDAYTPDELAGLDVERIVRDALDRVYPEWSGAFKSDLAERLDTLIRETDAFYSGQGLDLTGLRDAVRRAEAVAQLTDVFEQGMTDINADLRVATIRALEDAIRSGSIDRDALRDEIGRLAGTSERKARVQTQAALGAYNQQYRNAVSDRAGLDHFHYYGPLQRNTRAFCRIHRDRVFKRGQIEQMENGMLEPVLTYRGGWNCIHSWLPVDPSWDADLAARVCPDVPPSVLPLNAMGTRRLVVFAEAGRVDRLRAQMQLEGKGYEQIFDAATNDRGYVALHRSWFDALGTDRRTREYKRMMRLRELAGRLAEEGHTVLLTKADTADLIVDGERYRADV
ncbi:MAG: hypothetical protein LCH53_05265 [Bacteroidetes bacterium]|nr:hypothetical protein [Bacteroidota bacterium]